MNTPAAQLVQSGPIAEARGAQGELDRRPRRIRPRCSPGSRRRSERPKTTWRRLQLQALDALTASRAGTIEGDRAIREHGRLRGADAH